MLTANRNLSVKGLSFIFGGKMEESITIYRNSFLIANANGYADKPSDAANLMPLGLHTGTKGNIMTTGAGEHHEIEIQRIPTWCPFTGAAQGDVGDLFYLADDEDVTKTAESKTWALPCLDWKSGYVLLDFSNPIKTAQRRYVWLQELFLKEI